MLAIHANIESERLPRNISSHFPPSFSFLSPWPLQCREFGCAFHKVQSSQSTSSKAQKNLHSFNFPSSLLNSYSARSFCLHSTKCSLPSLNLSALKKLGSTHSVRYFPFRGEWRLRSKQNLESSSCPAKYPDVSTKTNQLHLLINRRKTERRRNLRIL